jgi:hypothetical protein
METKVTGFRTERNLSIVQLATSGQDTFSYVACNRAIREKQIDVKEMNDAGIVNTIFVLNNSDKFVFLMDGDILAGAKQNRVVNTSILLAPHSKTQIPVSCVEHGRWRHTSSSFTGTDATAPTFLRAVKADQIRASLKAQRGFMSDQGEIWDRVADYQRIHKTGSVTGNLSDTYAQKADDFEKYIEHFLPAPIANGMAVFFGKKLVGIDIFNRRDVFAEYFPKLLRGAALEAETGKPSKAVLTEAEATYRSLETLDTIEQQPFEEQNGVGVGLDRRFDSGSVNGFELVYGNQVIHLAAFVTVKKTK